MRWPVTIAVLLALVGCGLLIYSASLPVYTDSKAPSRLTLELAKAPRETRFKEWYTRLRTYETPHKKVSDWGRGLIAAAAGLATASGFLVLYGQQAWMRSLSGIFGLWLGAWAIRIPLSMWYYAIRQMRFDYPGWADSIAIPIFQESLAWILGAGISSIVLRLLLIRHPLPARIQLVRPHSIFGWVRAIILLLWLAILLFFVFEGIFDGNEGMTFSGLVAAAILIVFFSAPETRPVPERASEAQSAEPNEDRIAST